MHVASFFRAFRATRYYKPWLTLTRSLMNRTWAKMSFLSVFNPFEASLLQSSFEAAWYSWAGRMFLRRALRCIHWMVCIVCLEYTSIPELKIASAVVIDFDLSP